jgi:hypothetical protein
MKIDWSKVALSHSERGFLEALRTILAEYVEVNKLFLRRIAPRPRRLGTAG